VLILVAWPAAWRRRGDACCPIARAHRLIGPLVGIALFLALTPYGEMRFTYPALLLLFACSPSQ